MSFLSKLAAAITGAPAAPRTRILSDTVVTGSPGSASDSNDARRRRGRRGGRGRGRGGAAATEGTTTHSSSTQTDPRRNGNNRNDGRSANPRNPEPRRDFRDNRDARDNRDNRDNRDGRDTRWRRPNRDTLDAPLPEDVAFRPATEGGDASILPARRRPPVGSPRPGRVLYAGINQYVTRDGVTIAPPPALRDTPASGSPFDGDSLPPFATDEATHDGAEGDDGEPGADGEAPKRRRRGRRGGRGRRRGGEAQTAEGSLQGEPLADLDDIEDEDDATYLDADSDPLSPPSLTPSPVVGEGLPGAGPDHWGEGLDSEDSEDSEDLDALADSDDLTPAVLEPDDDFESAPEPEPAVRAPRGLRETLAPVDPADFPPAFVALGLSTTTLEAVTRFGFQQPTPIQEQAIPLLLHGRDIVGVAQTGTGKTLAFGLPMLERLDPDRRGGVQGLVLVPTRELAHQVYEVLRDLGTAYGLDVVPLLGGRSLDRDFRALERQPHIVVGTPGRVIDHLHRGTLTLGDVRYAVLDEADQMLDIGFLPDITRILSRTPRRRQTALFSATMPYTIVKLVRRFMEQPETVAIAPQGTTVESVTQVYFEVAQRDKVRGLYELIERELKGRTLVFSRTRRGVDFLAEQLGASGIRAGALHGDMEQRRRDQVVQQFRAGALDILIATNVAARGLDIPEITHVVNFDVPQNAEEYVHRIGRTGRAGREGKAITFVSERDMMEFDVLLRAYGEHLVKEELNLYG